MHQPLIHFIINKKFNSFAAEFFDIS